MLETFKRNKENLCNSLTYCRDVKLADNWALGKRASLQKPDQNAEACWFHQMAACPAPRGSIWTSHEMHTHANSCTCKPTQGWKIWTYVCNSAFSHKGKLETLNANKEHVHGACRPMQPPVFVCVCAWMSVYPCERWSLAAFCVSSADFLVCSSAQVTALQPSLQVSV